MFSTLPPLKSAVAALAILFATFAACLVPAHAADSPSAATAAKKKPKVAKVVVSKITVKGKRVTVAGRVSLPVNTAKQRKRTRVALMLTNSARKVERFTAKIDSKRKFKATKTTKLTGTLTVGALVKIGGKQSGKKIAKRFKGPAGAKTPGKGGGGDKGPEAGKPVGTPLIGTFKFDEGVSYPDGSHSGTYFRMGNLLNNSSRSRDKNITLLRPGIDGGLRTDAYQPRSDPYFDNSGVLSNRIIQRELFFGQYFTIYTEPKDFQDGYAPIAIPQISHQDGKLTGQVTAWVANWAKGALFNQGTPKPNGTLPGFTTPLTGTYDPATRRYTLDWTSLIVGGPFNGFGGTWHLEGTFEPAG